MLKVTLLLSGGLGYEMLSKLFYNPKVEIVSVFTDRNSTDIITFCKTKLIKIFIGNPRKQKEKVKQFLEKIGISDIIFSINYLFIIDEVLINYPKLYALNIHGALLPKYRGRTPHVWAIINDENITGITVHKIEDEVDSGDILLQQEINILQSDTGYDLLLKFKKMYPVLIDKSIDLILKNKETFIPQDKTKATYFGKRTPDDGLINWNWYKKRIYNWVRAQANPYPGAFTFYKNAKIIINKVAFSEFGYEYNIPNGTILSVKPFIVKTPNGGIEIEDFVIDKKIILEKGDILK